MPFGSPGVFPFPAAGGPSFIKFRQLQANYEDVTDRHDYEDGGASYVLANDTGVIRWIIEYNGLTAAQFTTLANHYADAIEAFGFQITNPRTSTVYTDVHYEKWEEDHTKIWNNKVTVTLVKRPA